MLFNVIARSLRLKLLLVFILLLFAFIAIHAFIRVFWILPQFSALEAASDLKDAQRVVAAFDRIYDELETVVYDNAVWDELYHVIKKENKHYLRENYFLAESFSSLKINGMHFYSPEFESIDYLILDNLQKPLQNSIFINPTEEIKNSALISSSDVLNNQRAPVFKRGLINDESNIIMFVSGSVMPSNEKGDIAGTMLVWRYVDERVTKLLRQILQSEISLLSLTGEGSIPETAFHVRELELGKNFRNRDNNVYLLFDDLEGIPSLMVSYRAPKRMFEDSWLENSLVAAILASFTLLIFLFFLLNEMLISPLKRLRNTIRKVMNEGDYEGTTSIHRQDEIGRLAHLIDILFEKVLSQQKQLVAHNIELRELSDTDELTGIANRRALKNYIERVGRELDESGIKLSFLMVDVDHFKLFNDEYGHKAGDQALRAVAQTMTEYTRESIDLVARYGGEEFAVLLMNIDQDKAVKVATKLCRAIENLKVENRASPTSHYLTISIGITFSDSVRNCSSETMFQMADRALYQAKKEGRNRVVYLPCKID
ncbi:diguanylate cyclase [Aliikangiella sp. G2MR2-5]|uniref:sensor domain-containing diguanylate cyclase n=1 Tax=Aliikangiella sp. G2MR2-5 TaxID=2788943 RepID=UPI0018A8DB02|nr:diguanylate cyclase [Aliikangiella sp. G2MR2-5]